jgi:dTDP-4-dehydrorhamnose reductase
MAVILITGAKGQLGNELKVISRKFFGMDFIFTDIDTLDITDAEKCAEFIKRKKPDWIINCAAYNFVDKAEGDFENALMVNGTAVKMQIRPTKRILYPILYQLMADQSWKVKRMQCFITDPSL